jgi:hypothetical protein
VENRQGCLQDISIFCDATGMSNETDNHLDPEHPERECLVKLPKMLDNLVDSGRLADHSLRARADEIRVYIASAKNAADRQHSSLREHAEDFGAKHYASKAVQAWNDLLDRLPV